MTRDELLALAKTQWNAQADEFNQWQHLSGEEMAACVAATALAALRPKLVWTDTEGREGRLSSEGRIGNLTVAMVYVGPNWCAIDIGDEDNYERPARPLAELKAEAERRVLEAMGWRTEDA